MKDIQLISPTGKSLRIMDHFGSGLYNAPRGNLKHNGIDFLCDPGQIILAPVDGVILRIAYPYAKKNYLGVYLENESLSLKMFYFTPDKKIIGKKVSRGQRIGIAQDISKLYNTGVKKMLPHIHLQIETIDPTLLLI